MSFRSWLAIAVLSCCGTRAVAVSCGAAGSVTFAIDNQTPAATVTVQVSGVRVVSGGACDEAGSGFATTYAASFDCGGGGVTKCGRVDGLAPGIWVHRLAVQVAGSAAQVQAQRGIVLASGPPGVSNFVDWVVFGRTFVIAAATDDAVLAALDQADAYTATHPGGALVRFEPTVFPGAAAPVTIAMRHNAMAPICDPDDVCGPPLDGRATTYCFTASRVTLDALDGDGQPGGVVLDVGPCQRSLFRVYGRDNLFRGLGLHGSGNGAPTIPTDTIAITSASATGNRIDQCRILGPTLGDGVSVENGATGALIVATEVEAAEDKGIKVTTGGQAVVERSCIHDNANGGVQATLGGTVTAIENIVQHNVGGQAQNGLFSGVPEEIGAPNSLTTLGNVVRFNGARGISIVNAGTATLMGDVVTDNYRVGLRVESTLAGIQPVATVRGVGIACNYAPGICLNGMGQVCRMADECPLMVCNSSAGSGVAATGTGVFLDVCPDPGCIEPLVDFGPGGNAVGRNAFTLNANPGAPLPGGINFSTRVLAAIPAAGNQWEHCDPPPVDNPNKCNVEQVELLDVRDLVAGPGPVELGSPIGPRHGPVPVVTGISPPRPRAGDLVRVYGGAFNAIDGAACHPAGLPGNACSAENPAVVAVNAGSPSQGNQVAVLIGGERFPTEVHQVTPSMLVFKMPVDCFSMATLEVARGNDVADLVVLCDPAGCGGRPVGSPCEDDDVCTLDEVCDGVGACTAATVLSCSGQCLTGTCDPTLGCVPKGATTACDDASACTVGDHCGGSDDTCLAGEPLVCTGQCLTGACDDASGCVARAATAGCDDGDACTQGDHCDGIADVCLGATLTCDDGKACTDDECDPAVGCIYTPVQDGTSCVGSDACHGVATCRAGVCTQGPPISCDDADACTVETCDPAAGCRNAPLDGLDGVTCHVTQLTTLMKALPVTQDRLAARLQGRVACLGAHVQAAADRPEGSRRRRVRARRAVRCVRGFINRARRAKELDASTRAQLRREGDEARIAVEDFFDVR